MLPIDGKGFLGAFVGALDAATRPAAPGGQGKAVGPATGRAGAELPDAQRLEAARSLGESGQPVRRGSFLDIRA